MLQQYNQMTKIFEKKKKKKKIKSKFLAYF